MDTTLAEKGESPSDNAALPSPPAGGPGLPAYAEAVASAAPTPGGGSVVAVVAALAAALGEMVRNLTTGRASGDAERELTTASGRLADLRRDLLRLAAADEAAYAAYRAASDLPKSTDAERAGRTTALQAALLAAADVPLAVATAGAALIAHLEPIARFGSRHALADAEAAAILAEAALRAALLNVRGNARLLRDKDRAAAYLRHADDLEATARTRAERVLETTRARNSPSP